MSSRHLAQKNNAYVDLTWSMQVDFTKHDRHTPIIYENPHTYIANLPEKNNVHVDLTEHARQTQAYTFTGEPSHNPMSQPWPI